MRQILFADQLGPHFDLGLPAVIIESPARLAARPYHRQKAHLILSALRHRAAQSDQIEWVTADSYRQFLAQSGGDWVAVNPTSYGFRRLVQMAGIQVLPSRGFVTSEAGFAAWAAGRGRLLLEDFYRWSRRDNQGLMEEGQPVGGRWNFDADNRQPPPRGQTRLDIPPPFQPVEDEIDQQVRRDLDRWEAEGKIRTLGADGPRRFAVTRQEALLALGQFVEHRLPWFGPFEDAALRDDWVMAHSLLSVPLNLGLLDPAEVVAAAVAAYQAGQAPLASVEGFVRQVMGWRDYVWHLYWYFGEAYREQNQLGARYPVPDSWLHLEAAHLQSACLSHAMNQLRHTGWLHHIERLMILGNFALQRGIDPAQLNQWFVDAFVDGTPWVMPANVIGMSQYADGGRMSSKPYLSGGAYINRMTNYCQGCRFDPAVRVGPRACPLTAGYWAFLERHRALLATNHRMAQPLAGLKRLSDLDLLIEQEKSRDTERL